MALIVVPRGGQGSMRDGAGAATTTGSGGQTRLAVGDLAQEQRRVGLQLVDVPLLVAALLVVGRRTDLQGRTNNL